VASSSAQRQDHKHYKSLYQYNPNDLAEYALPLVQDPKKLIGKKGARNQKKDEMEPIPGMMEEMEQEAQYDMDGNLIMEEGQEMEAMDDYDDEEMEADKDATENDFTYDEFKTMIEAQEESSKNDLAVQRRANFIKKGTAIWHILQ
jgi:hypothetical protein